MQPINKMSKIRHTFVPPIHSSPSKGKLRTLTHRSPHTSHSRKAHPYRHTTDSLMTHDTKPLTATPLTSRPSPKPDQSNPYLIITQPLVNYEPSLTEGAKGSLPKYQHSPKHVNKKAYLSQTQIKQRLLEKYLDGVFEKVSLNRVRPHKPIAYYTQRNQMRWKRATSMQQSART